MADVTSILTAAYSGIAQASYFTFGNINEGIRYILSKMPMQSKNKFEILLYQPYKLGALASILSSVDDALMTKLYMQTMTVPSDSFEYERHSGDKMGVKNITYADTVTMTFLVDQLGLSIRYLNSWKNDIAERTLGGSYVFKDNQLEAKRDAILTLTTDTGIPLFSGRFMLRGLNLKSIEEFTIGHGENDDLILSAQFSLDSVEYFNI